MAWGRRVEIVVSALEGMEATSLMLFSYTSGSVRIDAVDLDDGRALGQVSSDDNLQA